MTSLPKGIPNVLTIIRVLLTPLICVLLIFQLHNWALVFFLLASFTDFLDGYIARRFGLSSNLGAFIDPIADKFLVHTILWTLYFSTSLYISLFFLITILVRDCFISIIRTSNDSTKLRVNKISKLKTGLMYLFITYLFAILLNNSLLTVSKQAPFLIIFQIVIFLLTFAGLYSYLSAYFKK